MPSVPLGSPSARTLVRELDHAVNRHGRSEKSPAVHDAVTAATRAWSAIARLIAGRPVYRTQNAAGQYLRVSERPLTAELPARPAAVMIYSSEGTCTTICLDFDAPKVTAETLRNDLARMRAALTSTGTVFVEDHSASGGHHLYIPLAEPLRRAEARDLVEHLALVFSSLDPAPHRSIKSGCIRVPGSRHRRRGTYQTLITPEREALAAFAGPNPLHLLQQLRAFFPLETSAAPVRPSPTSALRSGLLSGARLQADGDLKFLAEEGVVPARYSSPSEARMAALCSLAASGWTETDVTSQISAGGLPGLQSLFSKYSPAQSARTLAREWSKASSFVQKNKAKPSRKKHGAKSDMNLVSTSQRAGGWDEHGFIRAVRSVLDVYDLRLRDALPPRQVPGAQLLLRAVLAFGHMTGSREISVGCRSLALSTGQSYQTVARLLAQLSSMPGSPVRKKHPGVGLEADTYAIVADEGLAPVAERRGMARGSIHALRPVFRVLGPVCALVYEAIERAGATTMGELSRYTGFNRSTVRAAVYDMQVHGMVREVLGQWRINHAVSLSALARDLGGLGDFEAQLHRYRMQRRAWQAVVLAYSAARADGPAQVYEEELYDLEREVYWVPPDQMGYTGPELVLHAA